MKKFNFQTIMKHGCLIIPKALLQQQIEEQGIREGEIEAFLKILMKVNYSDTQYNNRQHTDSPCKRGESLRSYRDWSRIFHWPIKRTFLFIHNLDKLGVIKIIPHPGDTSLHIQVVEYETWVGGKPDSINPKKKVANERFQVFWDGYHNTTQLPKVNIAKAQREWKKLSSEEQQKAIDNIEEYYFHQTNFKFLMQGATYLANKAFLNEY